MLDIAEETKRATASASKGRNQPEESFRLTIKHSLLLKAVNGASACVGRRNTLPILNYLKLQVAEGKLSITGTNLDVEICAEVEGEGHGEACVPASRLRDLLKAMSSVETLSLTGEGNGKVDVVATDIRATFGSLPPGDFPMMSIGDPLWTLSLPDGVPAFLVGGVAEAMSTDTRRYDINGVCLKVHEGTGTAVATDGHRLMMRTIALESNSAEIAEIIVHREAVNHMLHQAGRGAADLTGYSPVKNKQCLYLDSVVKGIRVRSKLIDGKFPDWTRVVPKDAGSIVEVGVAEFRRGLGVARSVGLESVRAVKLKSTPSGLTLTSGNFNFDKVSVRVDCQNTSSTVVSAPEFGANISYLDGLARSIEALGSKTIRFEVIGSDDPVRIHPSAEIGGTLNLVMPMRV